MCWVVVLDFLAQSFGAVGNGDENDNGGDAAASQAQDRPSR
jgi:hypothetical protein